eukprot:15470464-Alexandrium_andersonii.AAC.1
MAVSHGRIEAREAPDTLEGLLAWPSSVVQPMFQDSGTAELLGHDPGVQRRQWFAKGLEVSTCYT